VAAGEDLDRQALTAALASSLRQAGLSHPQVTVRAVTAIARHPDTGKARCFIPTSNDDSPDGEQG
jgi:hypothetical protein